jgi:hypothetical protein
MIGRCISYECGSAEEETSTPTAFWFLAWLIFHPEDGGDTFLRNVCLHIVYTVLYLTRW